MQTKIVLLTAALLAMTTACPRQAKETACPSMATFPHVALPLDTPLKANGSYDVTLKVDGNTQTCTFTITGMGPSKSTDKHVAQSPTTRTNSTCVGLRVSGITNEGWIPGFEIEGTPKSVSLTMVKDTMMPIQVGGDLTYKPTELLGKGCGTTNVATLPITIDASRKAPVMRKTFAPTKRFGGRLGSGEPHRVIRTQEELDAFVALVPKVKITKGPKDPNPDPMAQGPSIDFSQEMVVVGTCSSFYCKVEVVGYEIVGDTMKVHLWLPPEPEGHHMLQRPVGMDGGDAFGNYVGLQVPTFKGTVTFIENHQATR